MDGTLYIILDSRSLFVYEYTEDHQLGTQDKLLVSGECVLNSVFQFTRLYNLSTGKKKRLNIYICDSNGENLIFDGSISGLTKELQFELMPKMLEEISEKIKPGEMKVSPTISKCLCKINGTRKKFGYNRSEKDRIILVDASDKDDYISQYVSLLNCGFASQKLVSLINNSNIRLSVTILNQDVVIDVVSVTRNPSPLLNNLVDICNGLNLKYSDMADSLVEGGVEISEDNYGLDQGLTPFLIFHLLPSIQAREEFFVSINKTKHTGLAVCFCHHQKIEIGYVCSSCLSIFCSQFKAPICSTCG
ncbi:transcription factor [Cryptosporidium ubiquitum]|uniref:Transcription factor n=1 Tax=Cryptosporidium ubiquitum TaxID=857276 RepID=A0A1J4MKN0_9CRYT|nr:transcription factor [Cryptosporidium ubiquitum]OII73421.1 transcription factor [Cryptosporidium ubiquitum]